MAEYAAPDVAPDIDVVVTATGRPSGLIVTEAFPDLVGSALLVAVTVADVPVATAGA